MQQRPGNKSPHGTKAIALDPNSMIAHNHLFLLISTILGAALALGLQIIFGR